MALRLQARLPLPIVSTALQIAGVKLSIASKSLLPGRKERNIDDSPEPLKVIIDRENRVTSIGCCGADQKIRVRALNAFSPAIVEEFRRSLVIVRLQNFVRKSSEVIAQNPKLFPGPHA